MLSESEALRTRSILGLGLSKVRVEELGFQSSAWIRHWSFHFLCLFPNSTGCHGGQGLCLFPIFPGLSFGFHVVLINVYSIYKRMKGQEGREKEERLTSSPQSLSTPWVLPITSLVHPTPT